MTYRLINVKMSVKVKGRGTRLGIQMYTIVLKKRNTWRYTWRYTK